MTSSVAKITNSTGKPVDACKYRPRFVFVCLFPFVLVFIWFYAVLFNYGYELEKKVWKKQQVIELQVRPEREGRGIKKMVHLFSIYR